MKPKPMTFSEKANRFNFYNLKFRSLTCYINKKVDKKCIDEFVNRVIGEIENINVKYKSFDRDRFVEMFNRMYNRRCHDEHSLYHIFIICFNRCCKYSKIVKTLVRDVCRYIKAKESKNFVVDGSVLSSFPVKTHSTHAMLLCVIVVSYIITRANFE